jgi:hypothetical protein
MLDCPASRQSGTGLKKTNVAETGPVPDYSKLTQSSVCLVRYRSKIWDAGMLMPALVSSMPMPSCAGDEYTEESQLQAGEYTKKFRLPPVVNIQGC